MWMQRKQTSSSHSMCANRQWGTHCWQAIDQGNTQMYISFLEMYLFVYPLFKSTIRHCIRHVCDMLPSPHVPEHTNIIQNTIRNYLQHFGQVTIYMRLLRPRHIDTYPAVVPHTHTPTHPQSTPSYTCASRVFVCTYISELKYVTQGDGAPKRETAMCHAWRTCQHGLSILVASL